MDLLAFRREAHRLRPICRRLNGLLLLAVCGCSPIAMSSESGGRTHLFVWAWDVDKGSDDFLAVVDVDRRSATYGQVITTLPAQGARGAHQPTTEEAVMKRFSIFALTVLIVGCARRVEVSTNAEWKGSCTINSWWIEVPRTLQMGKETTVKVHRCDGKNTPSTLRWLTSDPSVLALVSSDADAAVIRAVGKGMASIIANSEEPQGRSQMSVTVE